ncbi:MAG TPA: homoserine kinase [Halomicronema sp.]
MSSISTVTVTVPATTANMGPGFDCIGAALSIYNQFKFTRLDANKNSENEPVLEIYVKGLEAEGVNTDHTNLVYQAFLKFYHHIAQTPPALQIDIQLAVPLARGLGSSATAIVAGLVGANALAGNPLTQTQIMQLAISMEGHPDNVVPALLGGCRLAACDENNPQDWQICEISWHPEIVPVVAIPNFELSTSEARRVLPNDYSRADSIFNISHLGLLVRGIETANPDWLRVALQDKIHQPYRQPLIAGYQAVFSAALDSGAYGMTISGAGPTLLALSPQAKAIAVQKAMIEAWKQSGIVPDVQILQLDQAGASIIA